jgi:large subunit ribosomal protein L25
MEKFVLHADVRENLSKGYTRSLRRAGIIPAVYYGRGEPTLPIQVDVRALTKALHTEAGENVIFELHIRDNNNNVLKKTAVLREKQIHLTRRDIIHADFLHISLKEAIDTGVKIQLLGEESCPGIREGGIVDHAMWEVRVRCLPTKIPSHIDVDISNLKIGDSVFVKDLVVQDGVEITDDPEHLVLTILPPKEVKEEEVAEEEAVAEEKEGEKEPEVIGKGKKEEGEQ